MSITVGVVMDPIASIKTYKDTTLAMLLEVQRRGWSIEYLEMGDLFVRDGQPMGSMRPLRVADDDQNWFSLGERSERPLATLDVILMRKDPPFNMEFVYATYMLELAEQAGTLVVNRPSALRDVNEKMSIARFPQCCAPTLVSRDMARLRAFWREHEDVVVKPLDGMGGASVFRLRADDANVSVVLETLTEHGTRCAMAQRYVPDIVKGDKRILMIDGEPLPYALARVPLAGESRGNLAAGGRGEGVMLSERDQWICQQVGPWLREMGLIFVGLDVIGDYLTEINVTSPTCVRELDRIYDTNISARLMDAIEARRG